MLEHYLDIKKQNTNICKKMNESQNYYAKWKKMDTAKYIYYDSIYVNF